MSLSRQGLGGDCSHQEVEPSVLADLFSQVPVCQLHNQGLENCLAEDDLPVLLIFFVLHCVAAKQFAVVHSLLAQWDHPWPHAVTPLWSPSLPNECWKKRGYNKIRFGEYLKCILMFDGSALHLFKFLPPTFFLCVWFPLPPLFFCFTFFSYVFSASCMLSPQRAHKRSPRNQPAKQQASQTDKVTDVEHKDQINTHSSGNRLCNAVQKLNSWNGRQRGNSLLHREKNINLMNSGL